MIHQKSVIITAFPLKPDKEKQAYCGAPGKTVSANYARKDRNMRKEKFYAASERYPESGMIFDCARRYYPVADIKKLIDILSQNEGTFLQLHLTDNQNVGVECALLGQTAENAELLRDGSYRNPQTGRRFLSAAQIRDIIAYAGERNIKIIPEIDSPAHMEGFFRLAENRFGKDFADSLAYSRLDNPGELDISSAAAVRFIKRLCDEYAALFEDCSVFHIGCDEFFSGSREGKTAYIRTISSYMRDKGFTIRMWNDLMTKDNISELDKEIQVTYWSWDGYIKADVTSPRRLVRASVPDLQKEGFDILICNAYYLYFVPSPEKFNKHNNDFTITDLKNSWTVKKWDSDLGTELADTCHIIGSAVSMWSEDSAGLAEEDIIDQFIRHYKAMQEVNRNWPA